MSGAGSTRDPKVLYGLRYQCTYWRYKRILKNESLPSGRLHCNFVRGQQIVSLALGRTVEAETRFLKAGRTPTEQAALPYAGPAWIDMTAGTPPAYGWHRGVCRPTLLHTFGRFLVRKCPSI